MDSQSTGGRRRPVGGRGDGGLLVRSVLHVIGTAVLGALTVATVVLIPLFPLWTPILGRIEDRRSAFLLTGRSGRSGQTGGLRRGARGGARPIARPAPGWRAAVLAILEIGFALAALCLVVWVSVAVTAGHQVLEGSGIPLDASRWLLRPDAPIGQRTLALLVVGALLALALGAAAALARGQALLVGRLRGTELLEEQLSRFSERNTAIIDAFEAERRRIERELHDGPQQHLANAAIQLGLARDRIGPSPADTRLEEAQTQIEAAAEALRSAVEGLRPRILLEDGLCADLEQMARHAPIPVAVDCALDRRLDPAVESSLHFVVAEFLSNTYRHSHATRAEIQVTESGGQMLLRLRDDGVGGADVRRGTGLAGMRDRARMLGGRLRIDSPSGGPTTLELAFPETPRPGGRG